MYNSTEDPSQIRFGGYNEELFKEGHKQAWMKTMSKLSWVVKFSNAGFNKDNIW